MITSHKDTQREIGIKKMKCGFCNNITEHIVYMDDEKNNIFSCIECNPHLKKKRLQHEK